MNWASASGRIIARAAAPAFEAGRVGHVSPSHSLAPVQADVRSYRGPGCRRPGRVVTPEG